MGPWPRLSFASARLVLELGLASLRHRAAGGKGRPPLGRTPISAAGFDSRSRSTGARAGASVPCALPRCHDSLEAGPICAAGCHPSVDGSPSETAAAAQHSGPHRPTDQSRRFL
ncbi:hypothetical protein NDU88_007522 [Pleurodeles waltl]|uniref:Secreted protein n=1 Tax=Pleurodeles waltl TaxID=8319 RepID=A0AAV7VTX2_PLEWA|nr:hypothetical protein NDU88_007522 [Pleurodeles waltl]